MSADSLDSHCTVEWQDLGREPQCAPDPAYPTGKDLRLADQSIPHCDVALPYPAKRCGLYIVECKRCGYRMGITTAGRPDDPRSVQIACHYEGAVH